MNKLCTLILACLLSFALFGQESSLKGIVSDTNTKVGIAYANVILVNPLDSAFSLITISDEKGNFYFDKIPSGRYNLNVHFIGYDPIIIDNIEISDEVNLGKIYLHLATESLKEATVIGSKSPIKYEVDRKVIDASSFPDAIVAMDLLHNVPSLYVDFEGKLTYRGDGSFKVYINGHPVSNGEEKLRQIPADRIDKIELITNPTAKYDAEGTAGIIHVVLKKNRLEGYAISTSIKYSTRDEYEYLFSIDKKGTRGGWYIEGQYGRYIWTDLTNKTNRTTVDGQNTMNVLSTTKNKGGGKTNYIEFGINYDLSKNDYFDFSVNIQPFSCKNFGDEDGDVVEKTYNTNILMTETFYKLNANKDLKFQYLGGELSYKHTFNQQKDHALSTYLSYSTYLNPLEEQQLDVKESIGSIERIGYKGTEENEVIINGKIEYEIPITEKIMIESGIEINTDHIPKVTSISGTFDNQDEISPFPGEPFNQEVDFAEDVYAGYLTFKNGWKKLDYKLGIRTEYTHRKANYNYIDGGGGNDAIPYKNNFWDFFPSAHITYSITETHQFSASYSSRIKRAKYYELIPLTQYSDVYSYYTGNEKLLPTYSNAYELGYTKSWGKNFLSIEIFGRQSKQVIQNYSRILTANITYSSPENVGNSWSTGLEVMGGVNIFRWWNFNASSSMYWYRLKVDIERTERKEEKFRTDIKLNNTFILPKSFTFRWAFHYNSPQVLVQGEQTGFFNSNMSLVKGIKNNTWRFTFAWSNIFDSYQYTSKMKGDGFFIENKKRNHSYVSFRIAYRFNNQK